MVVSDAGWRGGGALVATAGAPLRVLVPNPRLWTPDDPYLYDLKVRLLTPSGKVVDEVSSYAGLRTIGIINDPKGRPRIALNGKITFLHGPLDQGFWPDGIYTAPTDEALKFDLEQIKAMGMNFVRKHGKVEPARWYYWADKLGLMVWQDMPSLDVSLDIPVGPAPDPVPAAKANFEHGAVGDGGPAAQRHLDHRVGGVQRGLGRVRHRQGRQRRESRRPDADGEREQRGELLQIARPDSMAGDIYDDHTYVGPGRPVVNDERDDRAKVPDTQPVVVDRRVRVDGEYGGLGLVLDGNRWPGRPQAYEMADSQARLTERYVEVSQDLEKAVREGGLSGAIYTQTTDVENEVNGFLSYDRGLIKMAIPTVAERNRAVIAAGTDPTTAVDDADSADFTQSLRADNVRLLTNSR